MSTIRSQIAGVVLGGIGSILAATLVAFAAGLAVATTIPRTGQASSLAAEPAPSRCSLPLDRIGS
jgi:hypothetical protein